MKLKQFYYFQFRLWIINYSQVLINVIYSAVYDYIINNNSDNKGIFLYKIKHCIEMHLFHVGKSLDIFPLLFCGFSSDS
jgi:hypothetical protein